MWKKAAEQAMRGCRNTWWQDSPMPQSTGGYGWGCFRDLFSGLHSWNKKKVKRGRGVSPARRGIKDPNYLRIEEWQTHGRQNEKKTRFH